MLRSNQLNTVLLISLAISACDKTTEPPPPPPPPPSGGAFLVDAYPAEVTTSPLELSGSKPATHAVLVDGAERVAANDSQTWRLALTLVEGPNAFALRSQGPNGQMSDPVQVQIALDSMAPTVTDSFPVAESTSVNLNIEVRATFSETLDCSSVVATTAVLSAAAPLASTLSCAGQTITLRPEANLQPDTMHRVTILPEVKDLAGNTLAVPFVWSFRTGTEVDNTPPIDPAITAPSPIPADTFEAQLTVSGTKEAEANVEAIWTVDGAQQGGWQEIAALSAETTWTDDFPLMNGANGYTLRSRDAAGNLSCDGAVPCTVSFSILKQKMQQQVTPPTVNVISPTGSPWQVLVGTKATETSVWIDGQMFVPLSAETSWEHEVTLMPGMNNLSVTARDGFGNESAPVPANIDYVVPAPINANADLRIEFELKDMWNELGDEYLIEPEDREIAGFAPIIWLEGPLAWNDNGTPGDRNDDPTERCYFDQVNQERRYIHMASPLNYVTWGNFGGGFDELRGHWHEPNYNVANFFAAMVTAGYWEMAAEPMPRNVDRRDVNGRTPFWDPGDGACPPTWFLDGAFCAPRMVHGQAPLIDAITEATVRPRFDQQGVPALGNLQPLGSWTTGLMTYPRRPGDGAGRPQVRDPGRTWNWRNLQDQPLVRGAYLLTVLFALDRSERNQQPHWSNVLATDAETCWDNPAHDQTGARRAEAIVVFGEQDFEIFLDEKGPNEIVDACSSPRFGVRCGGDACDWNGDQNFENDPGCAAPASAVGSQVRYTAPQTGWPAPVRVRYCAGGTCP